METGKRCRFSEVAVDIVAAADEARFRDVMQAHHYLGALPGMGETGGGVAGFRPHLLRRADRLRAGLGAAVRVGQPGGKGQGTESLSVAVMFAKEWLVPRLNGFGGGKVDFVFNDDPGASVDPPGEADLVITWGQRSGGDEYTAEKLGEEEAFPVCTPGLLRRIEERGSFAGISLMHYADIPPGWDWPTWPEFLERTGLGGAGDGRDIRLGRGLIMGAARAGQGVAPANTTLSHDDLSGGRLARAGEASVVVRRGRLTPWNRGTSRLYCADQRPHGAPTIA